MIGRVFRLIVIETLYHKNLNSTDMNFHPQHPALLPLNLQVSSHSYTLHPLPIHIQTMPLYSTSMICLLFFGLLFPPNMLEATPIVFSVATCFSLTISILILYSVSAQRTPRFIHPSNSLDDGRGPDYLELWAWQYLQQGRG